MERLRKFTDDALVKRESIRIQMINEEKLANEKKLGHTMIASQIIELDKDSKVVPGVFAADFMPAPGAPKKLRDSWGNKGENTLQLLEHEQVYTKSIRILTDKNQQD